MESPEVDVMSRFRAQRTQEVFQQFQFLRNIKVQLLCMQSDFPIETPLARALEQEALGIAALMHREDPKMMDNGGEGKANA